MSEVLSQNEIDQLISALNEGSLVETPIEENESGIRIYDFRTANKIPRDQIRTLHIIHDNLARMLSTFFIGNLGTYCDLQVMSVEEQSFSEFANSVNASSLLAIMKMPPLKGSLLLEITPDVSYSILDSLLGGSGSPQELRRQFTEIDLVILEKVIKQMMPQISEAWTKVVKVNASLETLETSMQFAQIVSPNDTIVIITMSVKIGEHDDLINFCFPQMALEPIAKNLNTRVFQSSLPDGSQSESYQDPILQHLQTSPIPVKAILSETTLTVGDLINLQVGDVIQLESKLSDYIKLMVGHLPCLYGILGKKSNHYAVSIVGDIVEEDLEHE